MFAQTARVRRLAAQMLLVWLFALATGIVNACAMAPTAHAPMTHAPGCDACPDAHPAGAAQACAKFCADESTSVRAAKHDYDPWMGLGVAVVPTMALSVVVPAHVPDRRPHDAPPTAARIPVAIAFLRLMR